MSKYSATPAEKKIAKELMNLLDAPNKSIPKKKRGRPKKSVTKSSPKPKECPPGKVLNPKTNRCNKVKSKKKPKKPKTPKTPKSPKTPSPSLKQYAKFYNIIDEIDPDNDGYEIDDKYDNDKHFINIINGLKKTILKDLKLGDILFVGTAGGDEYGFIIYLDNDIYYGENGYSGPIRYLKDCREGMGKEKECEKMKTIRYSKLVMDLHDNNQEMYGLFGGDWLGLDDIKKEYEALGIW